MAAVFETERCTLRELIPADAGHFFDLNSDPEVIRYTGDLPFENEEAALEFLKNYREYHNHRMGRWAVIRKSDQEWLGWCGLKYIPSLDQVDLGYRFFRKFWGSGYATETALASIDYGFNQLHLKRIVGRAAVDNVASIRVLEKCGMNFLKHAVEHDQDVVIYEIFTSN